MRHSPQFEILCAAACFGLTCTLSAQAFKLDSIHYDGFGGLVTLGWQTEPGGVYSVHSSTNLTSWEELSSGAEPLRFLAANGSRTQTELALPTGPRTFWRIGTRPIFDVGTLLSSAVGRSGPSLADVNEDSRVVGTFEYGWPPILIGFTWAPGEQIHSFGTETYATAVNSGGTVVGTRYGVGKFFAWTRSGGSVELGDGRAVDVNSAGHIVGQDNFGAFLWKSGTGKIRIPPLLPNEPFSGPNAISDAGHVVGASRDSGSTRAFLWTESGGVIDLNAGWGSSATHVNSSGLVVGYRWVGSPSFGEARAFAWSAATGLVTFPFGCEITDLSENGKVVGHGYRGGNGNDAFSWTQAGGITSLGVEGRPQHVNDLGQIVGYKSIGETSAILWSPTGGQTELEGLSTQFTVARLINNSGVAFGYSRLPGGLTSHVVMWTINPTP